MKKTLLLMFALVASIGMAWADKTVYLNPGVWETGGAIFEAWMYGASDATSDAWAAPVSKIKVSGTTYYKFVVSDSYTKVIFHRAGSVANAHLWSSDDLWNTISPGDAASDNTFDNNTLYTVTGWGEGVKECPYSKSTFTADPYSDAAKKTIYLWPTSLWSADSPAFSVYAFTDDNNNCWVPFTAIESSNGIYTAQVPTNCSAMILVRGSNAKSPIMTFDNKWNQTGNITLADVEDNSLFKITSAGSPNGATFSTSNNLALIGSVIANVSDASASLAINGNDGDRWEASAGDITTAVNNGTITNEQDVTWTLNLGSAQTFNTVKILWEGAYSKSYKIYTSTDGVSYSEVVNVSEVTPSLKPTYTTHTFAATTAQYIKFANVERGTGYGVSFWEFEVYKIESGSLSTLTLSDEFHLSGSAFDVTALPVDGAGISVEGVSYTVSPSTGVTVSGNTISFASDVADGYYTVTASKDENEATAKILVLASANHAQSSDALSVYPGFAVDGNKYNGGYGSIQTVTLADGHNGIYAQGVGTLGFTGFGDALNDVKTYTKIHLDFYAEQGGTLAVRLDGTATPNPYPTATYYSGWNSIDVALTFGETTVVTWVFAEFSGGNVSGDNNVVLENIYFSKEAVVVPFVVSVSGNVATVSGPLTAENVSEVNAATTASLIDLREATVTGTPTINNGNANALILLSKDYDTNPLGNTTNVLYYKLNAYNVPLTNINWTDGNGDIYTFGTINGSGAGLNVTYTRSVAAGKYATITLPVDLPLPENVNAYELSTYSSGTVTLTKAESFVANTPYIIHNAGASAAVITFTSSNADLTFGESTATNGGATFTGTYNKIAADGTQFIIQNGQLVKANTGVTIGAFRAYFTGLSASSARLSFIDDETTGINAIENEKNDVKMYDLQGRRVATPQKGLYIVNGKKMLVK